MAEFWCIIGGIFCDLELQESKQQTRYRPGKSKGAGSPTMATRPHFKPWLRLERWKRRGVGNVWRDHGRRHGFESGGGDNFASGASKNIVVTPPLFGQWGGDKILLR